MHRLSDSLFAALQDGLLAPLVDRVRRDRDLDLNCRDRAVTVYYKGHGLLTLTQVGAQQRFRPTLDPKFRTGLNLVDVVDAASMNATLALIPHIKENIVLHQSTSLEMEYEQLLIRANNLEPRTNGEYLIVDRQYVVGPSRFDLVGLVWPRERRRTHQEVAPCFLEVKYAQNGDIATLHEQVEGYYAAVRAQATSIAADIEAMFRQKLALNLYTKTPEQLRAMDTLRGSSDINRFQFVIVLVDYNPHSTLLDRATLAALPFANQIRLWNAGFALWQERLIKAEG